MYYEAEEIGKRIRQMRRAKGMTQEQLAEKLNVSPDHLAKVETGKHGCSLEILIDISIFFAVSLDYLVLGTIRRDAAARVDAVIAELIALKQML